MQTIRIPLAFVLFALIASVLSAAGVGNVVSNVEIRDSEDEPHWITGLGKKKAVVVFYADPEAADMNDEFADLLKDADLDLKRFEGVGIASLADLWVPDAIIRMIIRRKEKQYNTNILTDPDHILKKKWGLAEIDERQVIIVLDQKRKIHYIKYGKLNAKEQDKAFTIIRQLMDK